MSCREFAREDHRGVGYARERISTRVRKIVRSTSHSCIQCVDARTATRVSRELHHEESALSIEKRRDASRSDGNHDDDDDGAYISDQEINCIARGSTYSEAFTYLSALTSLEPNRGEQSNLINARGALCNLTYRHLSREKKREKDRQKPKIKIRFW